MKQKVFHTSRLKKSRATTFKSRLEKAIKEIQFLLRGKDESMIELFTKLQAIAFVRSSKFNQDKKELLAKQIFNLIEMVAIDKELDYRELESGAMGSIQNKIISDEGIQKIISYAIDYVMKKHSKQFV